MKKILVIGSLNVDLVARVEKTPAVGETVLGCDLHQYPGGKGANQAAAIGRLGGDVTLLGKIGGDSYGQQLLKELEVSRVQSDRILISEQAPTGLALITVNEDGDNAIVVIPGANFELAPDDIEAELIAGFDILVAQLEVPSATLAKAFRLAKQNGLYTILNPAPARPLDPVFLADIDLLIPNQHELEALTGIRCHHASDLDAAYQGLKTAGVREVVVTLGSQGALWIGANGREPIPAIAGKATDTTAAGDSFIGALAYRLAHGDPIVTAAEFGCLAAAVTVTRHGAQSSLPNLDEVLAVAELRSD